MRDGISTFRANRETLSGIQQKYYQKAIGQNIPQSENIVAEPGIDQTYANAMQLQKQIGPYVPPSQRGGVTGALSSVASKILGVGGDQPTQASTNQIIRMQGPDGKVRSIPASMKAEAIAAGGSVVK